jgi:hypothetical protein
LFFNCEAGDWRVHVRGRGSNAVGTLLNVYNRLNATEPCQHIIWIKPHAKAGLPVDVVVYAEANPTFPQQSTGDQFFDEAQWESYRAIGYCLIDALLSRSSVNADLFRKF